MRATILTTARLALTTWDKSGWAEFLAVTNTPEVMRHLGGVMDARCAEALWDDLYAYQHDYGFTYWRVERMNNGATLGFCGFARVDAPDCSVFGEIEVGWRLGKMAWGQGYAQEAARACLDYGFDTLGFDCVYALISGDNLASQRLAHRIGMRHREPLDFEDTRLSAHLNPITVFARMAPHASKARLMRSPTNSPAHR